MNPNFDNYPRSAPRSGSGAWAALAVTGAHGFGG